MFNNSQVKLFLKVFMAKKKFLIKELTAIDIDPEAVALLPKKNHAHPGIVCMSMKF